MIDTDNFDSCTPYRNRYGLDVAKFVITGDEGEEEILPIKINGKFKIFANKGNDYSLVIEIDDKNEKFFEKLEDTLSRLASTVLPAKRQDLKLIKRSERYSNIYCKIYANGDGHSRCYYSELIDGKHKTKRLEDAPFYEFERKCTLRVSHAICGKTKGITLSISEVLNYNSRKSYFDEYSEID